MKNFTKKILFCLCIIVSITGNLAWTEDDSSLPEQLKYPEPEIFGEAAILVNVENAQILYQKNAFAKMFPASTTKILTAIIAIENLNLEDVVTIDDESPFIGGSMMVINPGEKLTIRQLLYGLMVVSGNDCAMAIANYCSGSVPEFSKLMNDKAREIGAENSNFVNPHGLHHPDQFTTAYDLFLIANYAMKNNLFREIVKTSRYIIEPTNKQPETRYLNSTNKLFTEIAGSDHLITVNGNQVTVAYPDAIGIKTGTTDEAKNCLVSAATNSDNNTVIAVVLKSGDNELYQDSVRLLDYGLNGHIRHRFFDAGEKIDEITLNNQQKSKLTLVNKKPVDVWIPIDILPSEIEFHTVMNADVQLPIGNDKPIGKSFAKHGKTLLMSLDLYSKNVVHGRALIDSEITKHKLSKPFPWKKLLILFLIFLIAFHIINSFFKTFSSKQNNKNSPKDQGRYDSYF